MSIYSYNNTEIIKNEYWSASEGPAYAVFFNDFYFFDNGTFDHEFGYSGGAYWENHVLGKYKFDAKEKIITLTVTERSVVWDRAGIVTPSKIKIADITDDTVTFTEDNNTNVKTMKRRTGIIADGYWFEGWNSSHNRFSFRRTGYCEIRQDDVDYNGEYWLVDGVLYLLIKTSTFNRITNKFEPYIKTFINVDVGKDKVKIENVNFERVINWSRNWEYKNGQYTTDRVRPVSAWREYNRAAEQ